VAAGAAASVSVAALSATQTDALPRLSLLRNASTSRGRLYSPGSPFNRAIPANPRLAGNSRPLVQGLAAVARAGGFLVASGRWTVPVYLATSRTPRYRVSLTASWAPARSLIGVPIPRGARPDPSSDGQMAIIDPQTRCEYDFWQARKRAHGWSASWANSLHSTGSGVYPHGLSARGSGFALLAGLIWPEEIARGQIDHALIFSYPLTSAAGFVAPATESDGTANEPDAIPEGALLQLDPRLDVSSFPRYERIIARALQRYGMYLADTGQRNVSLFAVSGQSYAHNPYRTLMPGGDYSPLGDIPLTRFRVIKHGLVVRRSTRLAPSGCAQFR
jgi:hypothetical protein